MRPSGSEISLGNSHNISFSCILPSVPGWLLRFFWPHGYLAQRRPAHALLGARKLSPYPLLSHRPFGIVTNTIIVPINHHHVAQHRQPCSMKLEIKKTLQLRPFPTAKSDVCRAVSDMNRHQG